MSDFDPNGHLRRGLRAADKAELLATLRSWLANSNAPTIGDASEYGGRAWLHARIDGHEVDERVDVLMVPVNALLALTEGGHGVEVVASDGTTSNVPVGSRRTAKSDAITW
jgi:hypothetical protein